MSGTLIQTLEREREELGHLRFRLVETRLLLVVGELAELPVAAREVDQARQQVRATDLVRATTLARMGRSGTRDGLLTLRQVADDAALDEATLLRDHHEALCRLVAEIEVAAHRSAELARSCLHRLALADERTEDQTGAGFAEPPSAPAPHNDPATDLAGSPEPVVVHPWPEIDLRAPRRRSAPSATADPRAREGALQDTIAVSGRLRMPALLAFLR